MHSNNIRTTKKERVKSEIPEAERNLSKQLILFD
jgi:hypothetical protein